MVVFILLSLLNGLLLAWLASLNVGMLMMCTTTGKDLVKATSAEFTLTELKGMNLDAQIEVVTKVCDVAGKEFAMGKAKYMTCQIHHDSHVVFDHK